jgi:hypothetical protein
MAKEVQPGDPQSYRVQMQAATGRMTFVDVMASTGDEAAAKALAECPGAKVGHVEPTPQAPVARKKLGLPASDEKMVEIDSLGPDAKVVA